MHLPKGKAPHTPHAKQHWSDRPAMKVLYGLSTFFGVASFVIGIVGIATRMRNKERPPADIIIVSVCLTLCLGLNVPYLWPKVFARYVMIVLAIGWFTHTIFAGVAYAQGSPMNCTLESS